MSEPHQPDPTLAISTASGDALDAGLAAGFGRSTHAPGSVLSWLRPTLGPLGPVVLREADGESALVVKPRSDALPSVADAGDRYQLSGEIARGGMGAVLRGRDVDLGRDLAVKVLLEKYADRPEVARRFIEEAQIGGQLQHPGVVPVYDIGRFGDRPYFTMKLVKGQTLAALLSGRTDPNSDRPRMLSIVLQVAQTLAYAHAKGVIHRDLKPANIMVGAFGEVQVMDWGLAKVLASGGIADEEQASRAHQVHEDVTTIRTARSSGSGFGTDTEAGSLLGTPAYMPPEQANGEVAHLDRRADVFGLGAILCETLTGRPPYVGRSGEEVRRKAANGDLADALARLGSCEADADLIALTRACLAPEANDRPHDAQAVTDSLTAYLDGVQDRLRKAELAEAEAKTRAVEEARRRRLTLALAGTVLLAMALGGGGWLWVEGEREARRIALSRDVNDALNRATAARERAKAATVGSAALFAQARDQAQRALALVENGPADAALVVQVRQLQAGLNEEEKDRKLLAALDAAGLAQAETLSENRFADERAIPLFREAFRAYGLPVGEGDPVAAAARIRERPVLVREALLAAIEEWDDLASSPRLQVAEPHQEWLRAVLQAAEPEGDWAGQVRAARKEADMARRQRALEALAASADVRNLPARALNRLARQLPAARAAALLRRVQQQYPADFHVNNDLGMVLQAVTPPEREEAIRFLTAVVALRPESPGCRVNLGLVLRQKGQLDEAIACNRKAIELDPKYAIAYDNLGIIPNKRGQVDEAIATYRRAIEINPKDSPAHSGLGSSLAKKGRLDEAIATLRKAIELDPKDALPCTNLGNALKRKGRLDEAIACFRKAMELDPKYAAAHNGLAAVLKAKGQHNQAIATLRKAIELDPKEALYHGNLGTELLWKGQLDEAIATLRKAIELDPKDATANNNLGYALYLKGQFDAAIAICRRTLELMPNSAETHDTLGDLLRQKGQVDEAIACYRKAIELNPGLGEPRCNLGHCLRRQGRFTESLAAFRRGHELGMKRPGWGYPSAEWVRQAERCVAMEEKLPAFLKGEFHPADSASRLGLAGVCRGKKADFAAARLYADAFAADPTLADDLAAGHRYSAACAASLAASGQGEDAARIDDAERSRLRKQALDWLRADLSLWTRQLERSQPAPGTEARLPLLLSTYDPDLAGIRDAAALAKLPLEEREALTRLWADVAALLETAETPATREIGP